MKRSSVVVPTLHNKRAKRGISTPSGSGPLTPATSDSDIQLPTRTRGKDTLRAVDTELESSGFEDDDSGSSSSGRRRKVKVQRELSHVAIHGPPFPLSAYEGWTPPIEKLSESEAIQRLLKAHSELHAQDPGQPEYTYFQLDEFNVYRPAHSRRHELELVGLDKLSQDRYPEFLFDGILSVGDVKCYVQAVPFHILTVDGYGEFNRTDLSKQLCIQSRRAQRGDIWYSLGQPSVEYQRFYKPFLWLARFAKHFVDYLLDNEKVALHHFRRKFCEWLSTQYDADETFTSWIAQANLTDFRTTVAANYGFLIKECYSIDDALWSHPIWAEVDPARLKAIPEQRNLQKRTVVTPYAYDCFKSMYFGDQLERHEVADTVIGDVVRRKDGLRLTPKYNRQHQAADALTPLSIARESPEPLASVERGDVVSVTPEFGSKWTSAANLWFAYIQNVRLVGDCTVMDVLWLYEPKDTTIGKAVYPFANEIFLSDNCSCGKDALALECAIEKVDIAWFTKDPSAATGLFVRKKFRTVHEQDTYDFVDIHTADFECQCNQREPIFQECQRKYSPGDAVLVREYNHTIGEDRLQPAQIVSFDCARMCVKLRRLLRQSEINPMYGTRPNELVFTDELFDKPASMIIRECHVRYFTHAQVAQGDIATPYDRDGTGDFWFVAGQEPLATQHGLPLLDSDGELSFPPLRKGWDPKALPPKPKLTGMGIFCGGGTFDRGLEEGGAVKFQYAVDWASQALHSYRANVRRIEDVQYFLGSVNDYLAQAMAGSNEDCIARVGKVQFLSAGSPCPGFSALQNDKNSDLSRQNASMVASVVSFVDLYSPEYFVLENVVTMTNSMGPKKDENVFSQIVAALVGLGYQVQQFLMDAWAHGDPQLRSRVFIVASAPGLPPWPQPQHSHAHPTTKVTKKSLGKSSNGLLFGLRREDFTPFQHVSAADATADLPHIGDAQPGVCLRFPDHRVPNSEPTVNRQRMASVPHYPLGMGLIQAKNAGLLRGEALEHCDKLNQIRSLPNSRIYARVYPDGLFPTIITKLAIGDGIAGRVAHWNQNRLITLMEARRAQGFLDHEVLIGTVKDQLKIVGNSVDRKVALVLGLALRESWMGKHAATDEDTALGVIEESATDDEVQDEEMDDHELEDGVVQDIDTGNANEYVGGERTASPVAEKVKNEHGIDNRSAKIALLGLTEDNLGDIRVNGFAAINRIFAQRAAQGSQPSNSLGAGHDDTRAGGGS